MKNDNNNHPYEDADGDKQSYLPRPPLEQPLEDDLDDDVSLKVRESEDVLNTRRDCPAGSTHFGDEDFDVEEDYGDATWKEVVESCCCHTPEEWAWIFFGIVACAVLLYFFLFGLELMGSGAKVMSACKAGELFGDDTNPVAGVMVGILATVLLQSSSTTTSIVVTLVGDGNGSISVSQGIYMVMGCNIGTSVTNTIVAMGQVGDTDQLERAFAGATVHDMFNFMSVAVLFPLEMITGYLNHLTHAMTKGASLRHGDAWEGPVKKFVAPLGNKIIIANKEVTKSVASREKTCSDFYPMHCEGEPTYTSCGKQFGLIACDKTTGDCPAFFSEDATESDDKVSGGVVFFVSIMILFSCLIGLVAILQYMLLGMSTRVVYKATDVNGYIAICIGAFMTMLVQSSSITTSTLTPLVGMGAIRLEQMYPLTLGANIGTTITGITAALVADTIQSLQVAMAHLFFNVTGILIWYPIPFMRRIPLYAARRLGKATRVWGGFPLIYIAVMFVLMPMFFLGISALFQKGTKGYSVLAAFIVVSVFFGFAYTAYWCQYKDGRAKCYACMIQRERRRQALASLPDDLDLLKKRILMLAEHTGLPNDKEEDGRP